MMARKDERRVPTRTPTANTWVVEHILTAAVHGLMLCHARNAEAVRAFVAATRYPFDRQELNRDADFVGMSVLPSKVTRYCSLTRMLSRPAPRIRAYYWRIDCRWRRARQRYPDATTRRGGRARRSAANSRRFANACNERVHREPALGSRRHTRKCHIRAFHGASVSMKDKLAKSRRPRSSGITRLRDTENPEIARSEGAAWL